MKRLLFLLFFIPVIAMGQAVVPHATKTVSDYDQNLRARDTLFTDSKFVYKDTVIPVLDVSYHQFSSDSLNWHKTWVAGDNYIRISNNTKWTWKVLKILDILDPLWKRDANGGIYNTNVYDVHVRNGLQVDDSINTNNFYFLDGDSLKITQLNASDGTTGQVLINIGGVAYWSPITSIQDSGVYSMENKNHAGIGVYNDKASNTFYMRGVDVDSSFMAISLNNTNHTIVLAFDPTKLSVTAGTGLSGGGPFSSSGNVIVNLNIPELTTAVSYDSTDWFAMYDVSAGAHRKVNISTITGTSTNLDSVYWIAANDGDTRTVSNTTVVYFEEGDTLINIDVSNDSVIFTLNGCPVPTGGLAGQVLVKLSNADCDLGWAYPCDLVELCDSTSGEVTAKMCGYANPYIANIVPTTGYLNVGALSSANTTIGDYVIDWYLSGALSFTSATAGAGISNYILQPMNTPVASGTYTPKIRWVEINGQRYTSIAGQPGNYSPDLLTCLDDVVAAPYVCSDAITYSGYAYQVAYSYTTAASELRNREVSLDLGATSEYIEWYLNGMSSVLDTIRVYYDHAGTRTLLHQANVLTTYYKIEDISSFTYASGDKIIFKINASGANTYWTLRFRCVDSLATDSCTPIPASHNLVDTTQAVTVTWDAVNCLYNVDWHMVSLQHPVNDITTYSMFVSTGTASGSSLNPYGTVKQNTTVWGSALTGVGGSCETFVDTITFRYIDSTLSIIARNATDWARLKSQWTVLQNTVSTGYSADPNNINHYRTISTNWTHVKPTCPSDATTTTIPVLYSFYTPTGVTYSEDSMAIRFKQQNLSNPFDNEACNNDSAFVAAGIASISSSIATSNFQVKGKNFYYYWAGSKYVKTVYADSTYTGWGYYATNPTWYDICASPDLCTVVYGGGTIGTKRSFRVVIQDADNPTLGVDNYELWKDWDEVTCTVNPKLVYKKVSGVGTWYPANL